MTVGSAKLRLREEFGWRRIAMDGGELWFKGYLHRREAADVAREFAAVPADHRGILRWLDGLDGHFALVARRHGLTVAAVDPVRSIPVFFSPTPDGLVIDVHAGRLAAALGLAAVNPDGALAIAMAGYTISTDTLWNGLEQLGAGQCLIVDAAGASRKRYHRYEPWRADLSDDAGLRLKLEEVTLNILNKVIASAAGRPIVVPLSAGLDSRLIASGLVHLGYRNLRCFAYGLPGNYEARASERIAAALGVPWRFHAYTPSVQRRFFASDLHRDYLAYADTCCSCPFVQDLGAIYELKRDGYIPDDAILINGNSGDYISGMHVPSELATPEPGLSSEQRLRRILDAHINKHFRLWQALAMPANDALIRSRLTRELQEEKLSLMAPDVDFAFAEFLEFGDRQCKYVISGERIYEFLGHEWRLPLWDRDYLDFWQSAPLSAKRNQRLYRDMLQAANWGGVWGPEWRFPRYVSPAWLRYTLRPVLKALHAPMGSKSWHAFERRYLNWWMDAWAATAVVPYSRAVSDRRGARSFVAWHTEAYLRSKGIAWDGTPLETARCA